MRIPSGKTDQVIYFVAYDATDLITRKTGLTSFVAARSRNNATVTLYTTPTFTEISPTAMSGVYSLLIDEDTTIASTSDSEEYAVHITQASASCAPVTRTLELYRYPVTSGDSIATSSGAVTNVTNLATYTGNTKQTADVATLITTVGVAGAGLTSITGATLSAAYDPAKTASQAGDAMALTAGERTTTSGVIWAEVITGTTTAIQAMRGFLAAMLGKASGLDTNAPIYRNVADTKNVITATTDANGNRTAVTLDLT